MIKVANANMQQCEKAWSKELRMLREKVKEGKEWKKHFGSREASQVKGFVGMLPCLPFSITAKGSHWRDSPNHTNIWLFCAFVHGVSSAWNILPRPQLLTKCYSSFKVLVFGYPLSVGSLLKPSRTLWGSWAWEPFCSASMTLPEFQRAGSNSH